MIQNMEQYRSATTEIRIIDWVIELIRKSEMSEDDEDFEELT